MSVPTEDQTTLTTQPEAMVTKPLVLIACCGALVTFVATLASGAEAMLVAAAGTLLMVLLFGMTHLVDWVLATKAAVVSSDRGSSDRGGGLALSKRLAFGMLIRSACALAAMALAVRYFGIDNQLAVAIAMPLYCGLLMSEIGYAVSQQKVSQQNKHQDTLLTQSPPLQARI